MLLFPGVRWTDLATAAVACISPAGVWWTFWPGFREQLRERNRRKLEQLLKLKNQVDEIGRWAGNVYDSRSHDPDWYNLLWRVNAFDRQQLEAFNQVVVDGDYGKDLERALERLQTVADQFHQRLEQDKKFRDSVPANPSSSWEQVVYESKQKGAKLTTEEMDSVPGVLPILRRWYEQLYERNKATHVEGIGGPSSSGLHTAWKAADGALAAEQRRLQSARVTRWRWLGHATAVLFGAAGLLFMTDFWWSGAMAIKTRLFAVPAYHAPPVPVLQSAFSQQAPEAKAPAAAQGGVRPGALSAADSHATRKTPRESLPKDSH